MQEKMKLVYKVKYIFESPFTDEPMEMEESETSSFLVDQRGNFYTYGPMEKIEPIPERTTKSIEPLIKIDDEYYSLEELTNLVRNSK
ncbi:MAG: hypothetical protein ACOC3V_01545 [bacterium]